LRNEESIKVSCSGQGMDALGSASSTSKRRFQLSPVEANGALQFFEGWA
jgi:hypothetical protein